MLAAFVVYALLHITWLVIRRFLHKSPLDSLPGPPPSSWLLGNILDLFNPNGWDFHSEIRRLYGGAVKMRGVLGERFLLVHDPKALYHILIKDQGMYEVINIARSNLAFGPGLPGVSGEQHKKQRRIMNPVFSAKHMRDLIPIFYEVTERLRAALKKKVENGPQEIDVRDWTGRTALEIIGKSGMDYSFDSLMDDDDVHPYSKAVKRFTASLTGSVGFLVAPLIPLIAKIKLPRFKRFVAEQLPFQRVQETLHASDVVYRTSIDIIEAKKKAMASPHPEVVAEMASKKDIISLLMRANAETSKEDRLADDEVIAQISTLVFAAMDTTTSAVSRILHLLATHPNVQERLRNEIQDAQSLGQMDYDKLVSLPYLDAVCRETLRVYPPVTLGPARTALHDMILPLSKPIIDSAGKEVSEIFVESGTKIVLGIFAANVNPEIWGPDADVWSPERWLSSFPKSVEDARMPGVYSHLMTFSAGGRACIGFKFSQLEMKVMLSVLLTTFRFSVSDKPIAWRMNGITIPIVEGTDDTRAQLPLRLSLVAK